MNLFWEADFDDGAYLQRDAGAFDAVSNLTSAPRQQSHFRLAPNAPSLAPTLAPPPSSMPIHQLAHRAFGAPSAAPVLAPSRAPPRSDENARALALANNDAVPLPPIYTGGKKK
jgi:hypothetical protein